MKIKAISAFLDGEDRYEKNGEYSVTDLKGVIFMAHGWAIDANSQQDVALEVQSVSLSSADNLGEQNG